jgi:hypothetical protein
MQERLIQSGLIDTNPITGRAEAQRQHIRRQAYERLAHLLTPGLTYSLKEYSREAIPAHTREGSYLNLDQDEYARLYSVSLTFEALADATLDRGRWHKIGDAIPAPDGEDDPPIHSESVLVYGKTHDQHEVFYVTGWYSFTDRRWFTYLGDPEALVFVPSHWRYIDDDSDAPKGF